MPGGAFQDEQGDHPAGGCFRDPPETPGSPTSAEGCTILVRLRRFRTGDLARFVRRPGEGEAGPPRPGARSARAPFDDGAGRARLEDGAPGAEIQAPASTPSCPRRAIGSAVGRRPSTPASTSGPPGSGRSRSRRRRTWLRSRVWTPFRRRPTGTWCSSGPRMSRRAAGRRRATISSRCGSPAGPARWSAAWRRTFRRGAYCRTHRSSAWRGTGTRSRRRSPADGRRRRRSCSPCRPDRPPASPIPNAPRANRGWTPGIFAATGRRRWSATAPPPAPSIAGAGPKG